MFLKAFGLMMPAAAGGIWAVGGFDRPEYDKAIAQPPALVSAALANFDPVDLSGEGGFSSLPPIRIEKLEDGYRWTLMNGEKVGATLTIELEPVDGGAGTRVVGDVETGDLSGGIAPELALEGAITMLFTAALDAELAAFAAAGDPEKFAKAKERRENTRSAMGAAQLAANPKAIGDTFEQISNDMDAMAAAADYETAVGPNGVNYEAGKPTLDVSRNEDGY